ncbi:MAG: hypothetical protein IJV92_04770 [Phascolarctobacterium sp.]|nr:hypothetical protein [Phascolarctobacterium sp.]
MSDIIVNRVKINKEKFLRSKEKLKVFSQRAKTDVQIPKVADSDLYFFDHAVTGKELNRVTASVQGVLVKLNNLQIDTIKEFSEVYDTLAYLDKEYLNSIVMALKAAEEVDREIKAEQVRLNNTIERQIRTIVELKAFDKAVNERFEYIDNSTVALLNKIEMIGAQYQSKIIEMESRLEKLQARNSNDNRAFVIACVAILGVIAEAVYIITKLI